MNEREVSPVFDDTAEGDRPATIQDLHRLAHLALTVTRREGGLMTLKNGRTVGWHAHKPDFMHTERAKFFYEHNTGTVDYKRLHFRYLSQMYRQDDNVFRQSATELGSEVDIPNGWSTGELTTYDVHWTKNEPLHVRRIKMETPSYSQSELDRLNDVMLMNQVTEDMIGERRYEKLEEVRHLKVAGVEVSDDMRLSDMQTIWGVIYRLNKTKITSGSKRA